MKLGFIDYYLDEWHANHYPTMLRELSGGEIEVAYAPGAAALYKQQRRMNHDADPTL